MTPEQEANLLQTVAALEDAVTGLKSRVGTLETENTDLKLEIGSLVREQDRYDEHLAEQRVEIRGLDGQIANLREQLDARGRRLDMFHRHLEEGARARLAARLPPPAA